MTILGISAGASISSSTYRLTEKLTEAVASRTGSDVTIISLRDYARDIADAMTMGYANSRLESVFSQVAEAESIVAATPIYNTLPSGLFIGFFDVLPENTLRGKPVALGATGGTPRHGLTLDFVMRPMFVYLHARVPTTGVYAATEDWGAPGVGYDGTAGSSLASRIEREAGELAELMHGTPSQAGHRSQAARTDKETTREELTQADPTALYEDFVPFDQLLH